MNILSKKIYSPVPEAFGFDISDLSIKMVKLEARRNRVDIASFGKKNIPSNILKNGVIRDEKSFTELVREAAHEMSKKGSKTKWIVASLPEREAFLRVVQLPPMKVEDVRHAIKWSAEENIPLNLEEAYYDWQVIPSPPGAQLDHMDVLVVASPKQTINAYLRALEHAGLRVMALEIEPIAVARAVLPSQLQNEPVMIVDIGAMKTGVSIFSSGALRFTSTMEIAGHTITEALAEELKIGFSEAEKIKIEFGFDKEAQDGKIYGAMRPIADALAKQIMEYAYFYEDHDFHEHTSAKNKISKVLFCGGTSNIRHFVEYCSKKIKADVELANPWVNILQFPLKETPELPYEKSLSFATAIGLALRGILK